MRIGMQRITAVERLGHLGDPTSRGAGRHRKARDVHVGRNGLDPPANIGLWLHALEIPALGIGNPNGFTFHPATLNGNAKQRIVRRRCRNSTERYRP